MSFKSNQENDKHKRMLAPTEGSMSTSSNQYLFQF